MIKPVKHRNIADQVYEQLRDMIYRGEIDAGARMMSERDMAANFKVGRPTIRTAVQRLMDQGLVESRRGVGMFVLNQEQVIERYSAASPSYASEYRHEEFGVNFSLGVKGRF